MHISSDFLVIKSCDEIKKIAIVYIFHFVTTEISVERYKNIYIFSCLIIKINLNNLFALITKNRCNSLLI